MANYQNSDVWETLEDSARAFTVGGNVNDIAYLVPIFAANNKGSVAFYMECDRAIGLDIEIVDAHLLPLVVFSFA